jgi:hypothetical protein
VALALIFLSGAALVLESRTSRALIAYLVLAVTTSWAALAVAHAEANPVIFLASSLAGVIAAPLAIALLLRENRPAEALRPSFSVPVRLLIIAVAGLVAHAASGPVAFQPTWLVRSVAYVMLCGIATLIVYRNVLAQIVGLLTVDAAIRLAGAVAAPALPGAIELGAAFDAMIVALIGLAIVRALVRHEPALDVRALKRLRGGSRSSYSFRSSQPRSRSSSGRPPGGAMRGSRSRSPGRSCRWR